MGYKINNTEAVKHHQINTEYGDQKLSGKFYSSKGEQFTSKVVETLILPALNNHDSVINSRVSDIPCEPDYPIYSQTVIQNDIMEHPSRLNSVIARAVDGSKNKLEWYHKNYLDHVYAVSDDSGDILEHYRYTAFGEVTIYNESGQIQSESQIDNDILWNTRRLDEVTGLYLYKYRHYSAELGRWLGRDPIQEAGGVNLYAFVGNNGINYWDYLGLVEPTHVGNGTVQPSSFGPINVVEPLSPTNYAPPFPKNRNNRGFVPNIPSNITIPADTGKIPSTTTPTSPRANGNRAGGLAGGMSALAGILNSLASEKVMEEASKKCIELAANFEGEACIGCCTINLAYHNQGLSPYQAGINGALSTGHLARVSVVQGKCGAKNDEDQFNWSDSWSSDRVLDGYDIFNSSVQDPQDRRYYSIMRKERLGPDKYMALSISQIEVTLPGK